MGRYLSWLANAVLGVLCCFLVASSFNAVAAALLSPAPEELAPTGHAAPTSKRTWQDRQAILARNLFQSSLVEVATPVEESVELEATKLPLVLLGTYNDTGRPENSWAAVEDRDARTHLIVHVPDVIQGGKAEVVRIERRRIVLREGGTLRELALAEDPGLAEAPVARVAQRSPRARRTPAVPRRRTARRESRPAPATEATLRNPARLLSGGRAMPKYENGEMLGFEVSNIEPGSIYERAGLTDGDLITRLNDTDLTDPEQGAQFVMEFSNASQVTVHGRRADGSGFTLEVPLDEVAQD